MSKSKFAILTLLVFIIGIIVSYLVTFYIPDKISNSEKKGDYKTEIITEQDLEEILKIPYLEDNSKIIKQEIEILNNGYYNKSLNFYFPSKTRIKVLYEVNKDIIDQKEYYRQNYSSITNPEEYAGLNVEYIKDANNQNDVSILYRNLEYGTKHGLSLELDYEVYIYVIATDDADTYQVLVSTAYPYPVELKE